MLKISRYRIGMVVILTLALTLSLSFSLKALTEEAGTEANLPSSSTASLHNPTFDNHDWYEFNDRYGNWLPGSWLPDDDNNKDDDIPLSRRQDWRLWYQQGTAILEYDSENKKADHDQGIQMRTYDWDTSLPQEGGVYQVVYGTVPCLEYRFAMKAQGRPEEPGDALHGLKAGIARDGWHLSTNDPAVSSFPSTVKWGATKMYQNSYGEIAVTAEAWADRITVFTYGKSVGGRTSRILWDTGSFAEVTPARIYDPESYSSPSGIFGLADSIDGSGNVLIQWTTSQGAISQIYYRRTSGQSVEPTEPMSYTVYLPLVANGPEWQATALNKTSRTSHSFTLSGLAEGEYEYIVVSKGYTGGSACQTWVAKGDFIIP